MDSLEQKGTGTEYQYLGNHWELRVKIWYTYSIRDSKPLCQKSCKSERMRTSCPPGPSAQGGPYWKTAFTQYRENEIDNSESL